MSDVSNSTDAFDGKTLSRAPYRGIVAEMAREDGVTTSYIWQKINLWRDRVAIAVAKRKMAERDAKLAEDIAGVAA